MDFSMNPCDDIALSFYYLEVTKRGRSANIPCPTTV